MNAYLKRFKKKVYTAIRSVLVCLLFLNPLFVSAQREQAFQQTIEEAQAHKEAGRYDKALDLYQQSFKQGNDYLIDYYNAACYASLNQQPDLAFKLLIKSIQLGYLDKKWAQEDSDFASIRGDKRWSSVIAEFDKQEKKLAELFSKVKSVNHTDLIPFQQNGLWGYVHKESLKVIVKPAFKTLGFMGDCTDVYYRDDTRVHVKADGTISIKYPERSTNYGDDVIAVDVAHDDPGPYPSYASDFKGFTMNEKNEITGFSSIYNRYQPAFFNISGPFKINEKYYAVAHKSEKSGVIDQEGNPLPGFDFVHHELVRNYNAPEGVTWFYFKEQNGRGGFVSEKGETRLAGELIGYPYYSNNVRGLNIQFHEKQWGILDNVSMTWVIKPQSLRIQEINYTYKGDCKNRTEKDAIALYFLVLVEKNSYFIDKEMKAFKPR